MITQATLKDLFDYKDGELYWKKKICYKVVIGKSLGSKEFIGYKNCRIYGKNYRLHRLIFLYHHGYLPKEIDHIDGRKSNNKIENLREATKSQNMRNVKGIKSSSKCKNVSWSEARKKWIVRVVVNGKLKNLGGFEDLELADLVAHEARIKHYGNFANHV
jgi:hypothetical protein